MKDEKIVLTVEEAMSVIKDGDRVHTFMNGGIALLGADWDRSAIEEGFKNAKEISISGDSARSMKHGVVFFKDSGLAPGYVFVETDESKLLELESIK